MPETKLTPVGTLLVERSQHGDQVAYSAWKPADEPLRFLAVRSLEGRIYGRVDREELPEKATGAIRELVETARQAFQLDDARSEATNVETMIRSWWRAGAEQLAVDAILEAFPEADQAIRFGGMLLRGECDRCADTTYLPNRQLVNGAIPNNAPRCPDCAPGRY